MALHEAIESASWEMRLASGGGNIPQMPGEQFREVLLFKSRTMDGTLRKIAYGSRFGPHCMACCSNKFVWQVLHASHRGACHGDRPPYHILQFTHIAQSLKICGSGFVLVSVSAVVESAQLVVRPIQLTQSKALK